MRRAAKRKLLAAGAAVLAVAGIGLLLAQSGALPGAKAAHAPAGTTGEVAADTAAASKDPAVPVAAARVERRPLAAFHRAASSIEASRLVDVPSRAGGRVSRTAVEEGDWVAAGETLAELDNERQKLELRRAELQLAEQQRQLARAERMLSESLISQQDYDAQRTTCAQAEAERDLAALNLAETFVTAPFAGQITARRVVAGQQVQAGQTTYTLAEFQPLRVRVHLPETVATRIRLGEQVVLETDGAAAEIAGRIERISPVVDPATGTVQVTLRLPAQAEARVGGFVKARLTTDRKNDVLTIPKLALVDEGGLRSVFVAEADTVRKVEIATGLYDETHVEVTSGLEEGWTVITLGRGGLRTGARVEIQPGGRLSELAAR